MNARAAALAILLVHCAHVLLGLPALEGIEQALIGTAQALRP